jgi:hypothetical protein
MDTWSRNRLSSDQWIPRHVLKFKQRHAKHQAKRNRWRRSDNMGRLITLLDFSPADFKRFRTVLADRRLFGNHCLSEQGWLWIASVWPSDGMLCLHARRYMWSSWQVFRGVGLGVFSHKPIFSIFTPPIFVFALCSQRMNTFFQNTGLEYPNLKREHTELWIMAGRHASRYRTKPTHLYDHIFSMEHMSCWHQYFPLS